MGADRRTPHTPGEAGVWVFLAGDLIVFGIFFVLFLAARADQPALFAAAQRSLNQLVGALNTCLLLTSSLFVALAVNAVKGDTRLRPLAPRLFGVALTVGAGFVVVKVFEWRERFASGQSVTSNDFFMYYFMYTGIHLMHVLIGLGVLAALFTVSRRPAIEPQTQRLIESGAIFWHLVDLLWIILFALFYLVR